MTDLTKEKKYFIEHLEEVVELLTFLDKKGYSKEKMGELLLSGAAMLVFDEDARKEVVSTFDEICRFHLGMREEFETPPNFKELH